MTKRERLAEMISEYILIRARNPNDKRPFCEGLADYLIDHGACYIPYKRDQEIWVINKGDIHRCIVEDIVPYARGRHRLKLNDTTDQCMLAVDLDIFSEYCYFTYREAYEAMLQKLKEAFKTHD